MKKVKNILISGWAGSGKSSTAKLIAEKLGYQHFSGGYFFREEAKERGMSFKDFHIMVDDNHSIDIALDKRQKKFLEENNTVVVDSWVGYLLQPEAFKVFLELDEVVAAQRIHDDLLKNPDRVTEIVETFEETLANMRERKIKNRDRYREIYGYKDYLNPKHFNLVVDTGKNNLEEVVNKILIEYKKWFDE